VERDVLERRLALVAATHDEHVLHRRLLVSAGRTSRPSHPQVEREPARSTRAPTTSRSASTTARVGGVPTTTSRSTAWIERTGAGRTTGTATSPGGRCAAPRAGRTVTPTPAPTNATAVG